MHDRRNPPRRSAVIATAMLAGLAAAVLAGCGGGGNRKAAAVTSTPATYVGHVSGSRALVGVATVGDRIRAYVCDGKNLSAWFNGRLANGSAKLAAANGQRIDVSVANRSATGKVTLAGGRVLRFAAAPARGDAGLYRGESDGYLAGWIVLADGTQRGVFGNTSFSAALPSLTSKAIADGRLAITPIPIPGHTTVPIPIHIAPSGGLGATGT